MGETFLLVTMRRIFVFVSLSAICIPSLALAAMFTAPHELLSALTANGRPIDASVEFFAGAEDFSLHAKGYGALEGKDAATMKMRWTMDFTLHEGGEWARVTVDVAAARGMLYLRFRDVAGSPGAPITPSDFSGIEGKWIATPLEEAASGGRASIEDALGASTSEAESLWRRFVDGAFAFEGTRYAGGYSYVLELRPDALGHLLRMVSEEMGLEEDDADLKEVLALFREAMTLQVRVKADTNTANDAVFTRTHASLATHAEPRMQASLQMQWQRRMNTVYVEIPSDALPWGEAENLLPSEGFFGQGAEEEWQWADDDDEWMEEDEEGEDGESLPRQFPVRSVRSPRVLREDYRSIPRERPVASLRGCGTADPIEAIFLQRKGLCGKPLTMRVNDQLSPRRLRQRDVERQRQRELRDPSHWGEQSVGR